MSQGNNGSASRPSMPGRRTTSSRNWHNYAGQYEHVDFAVAHSLIAGAVDFVVFIGKNRRLGGRRCVTDGAGGRRAPRTAGSPARRSSSRPRSMAARSRVAGCGDHRRAGRGTGTPPGTTTPQPATSTIGGRLMGSVWLPVLLGAGIGGGVLLLIVGSARGHGGSDPAAVAGRPGGRGGPVAGVGRPDPGGGRRSAR